MCRGYPQLSTHLASALRQVAPTQLRALNLDTCSIQSSTAVSALAAVLGHLTSLQDLGLGNESSGHCGSRAHKNYFSGPSSAALSQALVGLPHLRTLQLKSCNVAFDAPDWRSLTQLTQLDLRRGTDPQAAVNLRDLANLLELRELRVTVTDAVAVDLAAALPELACLEKLCVEGCTAGTIRLDVVGVTALAFAASRHARMKELHVEDNGVLQPEAKSTIALCVMRGARCRVHFA